MNEVQKRFKLLRTLFRILGFFILAWLLWSVWPAIIYQPVKPLKAQYNKPYLKGSYHMHSNHSDGKGSIPELITAAKQAGLDWIILTDHGGPNTGSENSGGWVEGVLLIGASELSSDSGHMVVIGSDTNYKLPFEAQLAIDELNYRHGLTFIAHPYDNKIPWTDWRVSDFSGIEIFSVYESVKSTPWHRLIQFPVQYFINADFAILRALNYPQATLTQWEKINQTSRKISSGIFATDAHGRIPITRKFYLPIPSYKAMFSSLQIYIPLPAKPFTQLNTREATAHILSCIKKADYFNVIESLAEADGISIQYLPDQSINTDPDNLPWIFKLTQPFDSLSVKIYKDGHLHHEALVGESFQLQLTAKGRYRTELYLPDHAFSSLPWVVANPVDIPRVPTQNVIPVIENIIPAIFSTLLPDAYAIEKNVESYGEIVLDESADNLVPKTIMRYSLRLPKQSPDSWCSLAVRDPDILKQYIGNHQGIFCEISGSRRATFWLEIRTTDPLTNKEAWYRHSLVVDKEKTAVKIPFSQMKQIYGKTSELSERNISSLFISINNSTAFIPTEGELHVYQLGAYRDKKNIQP